MLKVEIGVKKGEAMVEASGDMMRLVAEASQVVNSIYRMFRKRDALRAEVFKTLVILSIGDETSPVWKEREDVGSVGICIVQPKKEES